MRWWVPACAFLCVAAMAGPQDYSPTRRVTGVIHVWGSPQMGKLLRLYEADFHELQPRVTFQDELKSTTTAVAGVYTGRAEVGLLGREIWPGEEEAFESVKGHAPRVVEVATGSYDVPKATFALMVFVPRGNPLASVSVEQLERVFAMADAADTVRTWGDLGLGGGWRKRPVHLYGFSRDNDKAQIFSKLVFRPGENWNCGLKEFANGADGVDAGDLIVKAVAADPDGIGISNVHYAIAGVKALAIAQRGEPSAVAATRESVADGSYPLTRAVYIVVDREGPAEELVNEFLRFVLSTRGREAVVKEGNYLPLPAGVAAKEMRELGGSAK